MYAVKRKKVSSALNMYNVTTMKYVMIDVAAGNNEQYRCLVCDAV
jgi:hypothetical protein